LIGAANLSIRYDAQCLVLQAQGHGQGQKPQQQQPSEEEEKTPNISFNAAIQTKATPPMSSKKILLLHEGDYPFPKPTSIKQPFP
jgi:hypothetical protein